MAAPKRAAIAAHPRRAGTIAVVATGLLAMSSAAAAAPRPCPLIGAVYRAGPHRLTLEAMPAGSVGSAIYTVWRFQSRDARGRLQSTLRMLYSCGNGRSLCMLSPESHPGPEVGYYSEVVGLNPDLSLTAGNDAPYAFILPNFATIDWSMAGDLLSTDIVYANRSAVPPDFDNRVSWRRVRCGPKT